MMLGKYSHHRNTATSWLFCFEVDNGENFMTGNFLKFELLTNFCKILDPPLSKENIEVDQ